MATAPAAARPTATVVPRKRKADVLSLLQQCEKATGSIEEKIRKTEQLELDAVLRSKLYVSCSNELLVLCGKLHQALKDYVSGPSIPALSFGSRRQCCTYTAVVQDVKSHPIEDGLFQVECSPTYEEMWRLTVERNRELVKDLEAKTNEAGHLRAEGADLRKEAVELRIENGRLKEQMSASQVIRQNEEIAQLQTQITALSRENQSLQADLFEARQKLSSERQHLESATASIGAKINQFERNVQQLEQEVLLLRSDKQRLTNENRRLKLLHEACDKKIRQAERTVIELSNERERFYRGLHASRERATIPTDVKRIDLLPSDRGQFAPLPFPTTAATSLPRSQSELVLSSPRQEHEPTSAPGASGFDDNFNPYSTYTLPSGARKNFESHFKRTTTAPKFSRTYNRYCPVCRLIYGPGGRKDTDVTTAALLSSAFSKDTARVCHDHSGHAAELLAASPQHVDVSLEGISAQFQSENKSLKRKVLSLEDDVQKAKRECVHLKAENESLKAVLEEARKCARQREEALLQRTFPAKSSGDAVLGDVLNVDLNSLRRKIGQLSRENADLTSGINDLKEKSIAEKTKSDAVIKRLDEERHKLRQDYEQALHASTAIQAAQKVLEARVVSQDQEIQRLRTAAVTFPPASTSSPMETESRKAAQERNERTISDLLERIGNSERERLTLDSKCEELNRRIRSLQFENDRLQADITELNSSRAKHQASFATVESQLKRAHEDLVQKEAEISTLRSNVSSIDTEYRAFRHSLNEQERSLVQLEIDLTNARLAKQTAEEAKESLARENEILVVELMELKEQIEALDHNIHKIEQEKLHVHDNVKEYITDIQRYQRLIEEKDNERDQLLLQYQSAINEQTSQAQRRIYTERETDDLRKQLDSQQLKLRQAERGLEMERTEKNNLINEQSRLQQQLRRAEALLAQTKQAVVDDEATCESLRRDLAAARQMIVALENDQIRLQQELIKKAVELENANSIVSDLRAEVGILQMKVDSEQVSVNQLEKHLQESRSRELQVEMSAETNMAEMRLLKERLADYEAKVEIQEREIGALKQRLRENQQELQRLDRDITERQLGRT